jgi:hypothetical protein
VPLLVLGADFDTVSGIPAPGAGKSPMAATAVTSTTTLLIAPGVRQAVLVLLADRHTMLSPSFCGAGGWQANDPTVALVFGIAPGSPCQPGLSGA